MKEFKCLLCGSSCCSFREEAEMPTLFPWEKRRLEKLLENPKFKPHLAYRIASNRYAVLLYRWIIEGRCPFLRHDNRCSIHAEKPLACKMYPLIVGIDDNTLRVSSSCKFVKTHKNSISRRSPEEVFPSEYYSALRVYIAIKLIDEVAALNGWRKIRIPLSIQGELLDIDEVVEVEPLLDRVEDILAKFSKKNT
ncbi:MAG: YkgJ family cysteine cluster protein [Thermoprotei archaeon]|nr:MAG: YkgJ family cysteine cluster protein [Thermoprotei archaeon]